MFAVLTKTANPIIEFKAADFICGLFLCWKHTMTLHLFDSYQRKIVPLKPIESEQVGLYSCGPTVYDRAHLGNLRTYLLVDVLRRVLAYNGHHVKHVMNITDVGHLVSDGDNGEDKMEKGARLQQQSAWHIAEKFEALFFADSGRLNIIAPTVVCRATDHIAEQIAYIESLAQRGFTYTVADGVYFDTSKLDDYGHLARLDAAGLRAGMRVEQGQKKSITDFALWKFSGTRSRQMEWPSPWGQGFPGWHIECSAMAEKYLGTLFDIHVGGEDHIPVHHSNEIAQSQGRNGNRMANIWLHGYFLQLDNEKISKSGRSLLLPELLERGFDPLSYRYLTLTAHYRRRLRFSWQSLASAAKALSRIRKMIVNTPTDGEIDSGYQQRFQRLVNRDLNMPGALALLWELVASELTPAIKRATIMNFDRVFALELDSVVGHRISGAAEVIAQQRQLARQQGDWTRSDQLRLQLVTMGYQVEDRRDSYALIPLELSEHDSD